MKKKFIKTVLFLISITSIFINLSINIRGESSLVSLESIKISANAQSEDCNNYDTDPDAYCKNDPWINCGLCKVLPSGVSCNESSTNHDCYDVTH